MTVTETQKNHIAKVFSGLLHPLFMPFYLAMAFLYFSPFKTLAPINVRMSYLAIISITFVINPVLILFLFKSIGQIKSINLHSHKERLKPMLAILLSYFVGVYFLQKLAAPAMLLILLRGICFAILIIALISIYWKISAHATGIGGALAVIMLMGVAYRVDLSTGAIAVALLAGCLGWSRLQLNHHDLKQVLYGFLVGFSAMMTTFSLNMYF